MPLDLNTLKALKRCALSLDLYLWLVVYRIFALRAPPRLSWQQLYRQFGVDPAKGVLVLYPSKPAILPEQQLQLVGIALKAPFPGQKSSLPTHAEQAGFCR